MYPATRFVRKEFLPVVDQNGIAKPVLMCILEELEDAEIEEIILVVGPGETAYFKQLFEPLHQDHISKLPERVREYENMIARIGKKIKLAVQEDRRGFGHAVYQAREYLDHEPVLLLLGDFVYKSNLNISCARQTINAYQKSGGQLTVSIKEIPPEDVVHYGVLAGSFDGKRSYLMNVREMAEKPAVQYAKDFLAVREARNKDSYFATFGQYVLTPDVFDALQADIEKHDRDDDRSEIQLTTALQKVLEAQGMTGVLIDGRSFDVGIPEAYVRTVAEFGI
jgi:UTP-glucose-1-phosphate uridylyltransferase